MGGVGVTDSRSWGVCVSAGGPELGRLWQARAWVDVHWVAQLRCVHIRTLGCNSASVETKVPVRTRSWVGGVAPGESRGARSMLFWRRGRKGGGQPTSAGTVSPRHLHAPREFMTDSSWGSPLWKPAEGRFPGWPGMDLRQPMWTAQGGELNTQKPWNAAGPDLDSVQLETFTVGLGAHV